ncbi:hypothetical protein [Mycolicibacterium novocastrense]
MRAGVPTLVLWNSADQPYWGAQVKQLKLASPRRFSKTTRETLVADLHPDPSPGVRGQST